MKKIVGNSLDKVPKCTKKEEKDFLDSRYVQQMKEKNRGVYRL